MNFNKYKINLSISNPISTYLILIGLFYYSCENTITDSSIGINYGVVINEINYHSTDDFDPEDWVGVFKGDNCVGARLWDTSSCGGGVCDVPVMGYEAFSETEGYMQSGDIPTFKIYDVSEEKFYNANATMVW